MLELERGGLRFEVKVENIEMEYPHIESRSIGSLLSVRILIPVFVSMCVVCTIMTERIVRDPTEVMPEMVDFMILNGWYCVGQTTEYRSQLVVRYNFHKQFVESNRVNDYMRQMIKFLEEGYWRENG